MPKASNRVTSLKPSGIRQIAEKAQTLKDPINLSIGQPYFEPPDLVREAAIAAIQGHRSRYTPTQGLPALRSALLTEYGARTGANLDDFDAIVSCGVGGTFLLSYMSLLDPGDEVLIPDPYFAMYRDLAHLVGAVPKIYDLNPDFEILAERVERAISEKTKLIVLNSPSNPTGVAVKQSELDAIVELAARKDIWVLYDEIYSLFSYDRPHANFNFKTDNVVVAGGFSKSHGVPGWRLGYAIAPKFLIAEMIKVQQYTIVCAPSALQAAVVDGFKVDLRPIVEEHAGYRNMLTSALKGKYEFARPDGAFYLYVKSPRGSATEFVTACADKNLICVPGSVFSLKDTHFRILYSAPVRDLERAIDVLDTMV